MPEALTTKERARIRPVLRDWQHHKRPMDDTLYWLDRFSQFLDIFAKTLPRAPAFLYRSERTDIPNNYEERFTSWSWNPGAVHNFGWGTRRMVVGAFRPADILVDFVRAELDTEHMQEVIILPGEYDVRPFRPATSGPDMGKNPAGMPRLLP